MPSGTDRHPSGAVHATGVLVLDLIYIALTMVLFAVVGLIAKGAEKL